MKEVKPGALREGGRRLALQVADVIEEHEAEYDQTEFVHLCGTPACIAGWTMWVVLGRPGSMRDVYLKEAKVPATGKSPEIPAQFDWGKMSKEAGKELELSMSEQDTLFHAMPYFFEQGWATAKEAAETLRSYAATGVVEWPEREVVM